MIQSSGTNQAESGEKSEFERIAHYCRQQPPLMHSVQSNVDTVLRIEVLKIVSGVPVSSVQPF